MELNSFLSRLQEMNNDYKSMSPEDVKKEVSKYMSKIKDPVVKRRVDSLIKQNNYEAALKAAIKYVQSDKRESKLSEESENFEVFAQTGTKERGKVKKATKYSINYPELLKTFRARGLNQITSIKDLRKVVKEVQNAMGFDGAQEEGEE